MGWYSRKIEIDGKDTFNRLVYTVTEDLIIILECKGHYGEKIDI
jgi:Txe/YoeB family toxin of Txe-Axe toxin-antitoxin module